MTENDVATREAVAAYIAALDALALARSQVQEADRATVRAREALVEAERLRRTAHEAVRDHETRLWVLRGASEGAGEA